MRKRGIVPDTVSYSTVIHACQRSHRPHRAMRWLEEMYKSGEIPNGFCFGAVVQALVHVGDVSNASRWLDEAVKVNADVSTACFGCVLSACARAGDAEVAERWLNEAAQRGVASSANYTAVAQAWTKAGDPGRAEAVRCRQVQAARP